MIYFVLQSLIGKASNISWIFRNKNYTLSRKYSNSRRSFKQKLSQMGLIYDIWKNQHLTKNYIVNKQN